MKAILEFSLPEEKDEFSYATAGTDALLLIEDVLSEIRSKLKYDSGYFSTWKDEGGSDRKADEHTLERVSQLIFDLKQDRNLPVIA